MQAKEGDFEKKNAVIFFKYFLIYVSLQTYFKYILFSRPLIRKIAFKEITSKLN